MINNNSNNNELPKNEEIEEVEETEIEEEEEDEDDDYEISDEHFEFIEEQKFELRLAESRVEFLSNLIKRNIDIIYDSTNTDAPWTEEEYAEALSDAADC